MFNCCPRPPHTLDADRPMGIEEQAGIVMGSEAVLPPLVSARFGGDPCIYICVVTREALLLIKLDSTKVLTRGIGNWPIPCLD